MVTAMRMHMNKHLSCHRPRGPYVPIQDLPEGLRSAEAAYVL